MIWPWSAGISRRAAKTRRGEETHEGMDQSPHPTSVTFSQRLFQKAPSCPKRGTGSEPARCLSPFSGRWRWKWGQAPAEDVRSQSPFPHAGTSGTDSQRLCGSA